MYKAVGVGDFLSDLTSGLSVTVGGGTPPPPPASSSAPNPIYCPEQAAMQALAQAMYPNDPPKRDIYLLTHGPGFATPGGWAGWCALQAQARNTLQPSPMPGPAPMPVLATQQTIGTAPTPSHWTTYAAIGAGVLGLGAVVWYLRK